MRPLNSAMAAKKHLLLLILQFVLCYSLDIIVTNQTFREGDLLISKNNIFVFGFFSPVKSTNRYLGIWFQEVTENSVVWVANRNNPITGSSGVLSINENGNLVVYQDPERKFPVWSSNVSLEVNDSCVAQLLDSGNLVLFQETSRRIVWQSFDYPTDTQLPDMSIGINQKTGQERILTSWRSENDPGTGEYSVKINPNGEPQIFIYKGLKPLWRNHPWPSRIFSSIYNYSFVVNADDIYLVSHVDESFIITKPMVDRSGVLKWLTWNEKEGVWKEFWSVPKTPCDMYGRCGPYGKCSPRNPNVLECSCLPGYEPKSPRDWNLRDASEGCVRKRLESSSVCRHGEGFLLVENVKFPDTLAALFQANVSSLQCEKECLMNCSCTAYASIQNDVWRNGCLTWYGQLIDTVDHMDGRLDLYVRVDAIELAESKAKSNDFIRKGLGILILSVTFAWITVIILAYLIIRRKRRRAINNQPGKRLFDPASGSIYYKNTLVANELRQSSHPTDIDFFDLSTLVAATDNFSPANKLGQGGFGSVYKGQLSDGQEIAVKQLSQNSEQGDEEFKNEVMLIAKLQHKNLVKLLGCCIERGEKMLIYEHMPNKSLDLFLFDQTRRSCLDWRKRFKIITGIARGILYLHQDSRLKIIHRDLKCSNILLDADMNAKISDFGLARIFRGDEVLKKTNKVVGTHGYMSPEYAVLGKFSTKSDVFSFGVILLEIISAKKNRGFHEEDNSFSLIGYVWELWRQDRVTEIVDVSLELSYPLNEALRCIQIGLLCVQENAVDRPTMAEVVMMLSSESALPCPKQPAFIFRSLGTVKKKGSNSINEVTITRFEAR